MSALRHFGNQFFDNDIEHCARGKAEQIRQSGHNHSRGENGQHRADGFDDAGKHAVGECASLAHAFRVERHGNDRALRKVLNGDAQRQCQRARRRDLRLTGEITRIDHADGHAFRNVVQRDGEHHHGCACQLALRAFGLAAVLMQMRNDMVEQQQKQHADVKADDGGHKRKFAHAHGLLDGRNQQAPHRRGDHHACGKARQRALHRVAERLFHEEHASRAERRAQKRNQNAIKRFPHRCLLKVS